MGERLHKNVDEKLQKVFFYIFYISNQICLEAVHTVFKPISNKGECVALLLL